MKILVTKSKRWWQFWISSKPQELIEGKDYSCNGRYVKFLKTPDKNDIVDITYEV